MKNEESRIQQQCISWFSTQHKKLWEAKKLHAVPNGGFRSKVTAAIMKQEGVLAGVWDLHLTIPIKHYAGMWIEIKAGKNKLTESQIAFRDSHLLNYQFAVCYSLDEFMKAINGYLV